MKAAVVSAATSAGSLTAQVAGVLADVVATSFDTPVARLDLLQWAEPIGRGLLTSRAVPELAPAVEMVTDVTALVVVTPVHNGAYSALFKAFFDQVPRGLLRSVPTLMACTGGSKRHSLVLDHVLRPYLATLRCLVIPTGISIGPNDWLPHGLPSQQVYGRMRRAVAELESLTAVGPILEAAEAAHPDPDDWPVDFAI